MKLRSGQSACRVLCNRNSVKLFIDLDWGAEMPLSCTHYCGRQTQVKGQTRLKSTTAMCIQAGSGKYPESGLLFPA